MFNGGADWESLWGIVAGCLCLPLWLEHVATLAGVFCTQNAKVL